MAYTVDLSGDLAQVDGLETVTTITIKGHSSDTTLSSVANCLRRALNKSDLAFLGQLGIASTELVWNVPNSGITPNELKPGDTLTDSTGAVWLVRFADKLSLGARWRCFCVRQRS